MVQFTAQTEQIARAYNISPEIVVLSFAIAAGAPIADAYRIITRQKPGMTPAQCETDCKQLITNNPGIKILIHRIKNKQNPATLKKQDLNNIQAYNINNISGNNNNSYLNGNNKVDNNINDNSANQTENELKTRAGLIKKIIDNVSLTSGKDAISGLQTLAKLQGFDKPDENESEEKRKYFLPWVSNCRSCALMKLYKEVINRKTPE